MSNIVMYTTQFCPYCVRAKQLLEDKLEDKDASVKEVRVDLNPEERAKMMRLSGRRTVPQIWIGDTHVGGFDELWALDRKGELEPLLESVST
jgi:glutaredoxin 3